MKQNVGSSLTDEAAEFARFMETLHNYDNSEQSPAFSIISKYITHRNDEGDVIRVYGILHSRSSALLNFVDNTDDEYIDSDLKEATASALGRLRSTFIPAQFANPWSHVVQTCIKKPDIQAVKYYSRTLRAYRPLVKIQQEDADKVIDALSEAYKEFVELDNVPAWAKKVVYDGIRDLSFALHNLFVCGHDEAIDNILKLHSTVEAVVKEVVKTQPGLGRLEKMAVSLVLLVDLFTAAPNVAQALPVWKGWIGTIAESTIPQLAPPLKRLEGPKNPETPEQA